MAKSKATFSKREKEKKRLKKREEKQQRKEERKANPGSSDFESMLAYVDEYGNITDTPPDPSIVRKKIKAEHIEIGIPRREEDVMPSERLGKISYFDDSKGYGFIMENETQEKYFVHISGLTEEVMENDKVSFELERGMKGMNAVKVKKV